jgi:hypothetical protein
VISNMERDMKNFQMAAYIMVATSMEDQKGLVDIPGLMVNVMKVSG